MNFFNYTLAVNGFPLRKSQKEFEKIKQLSQSELSNWQEYKKQEILNHHYNFNSYYKSQICKELPTTWDKVPVIKKENLQNPLNSLITKPFIPSKVYIGSTSGSSGHPFFYAKDKYCHAMTYSLIIDRYSWFDLEIGQMQARFYGIPLSGLSRTTEQIKDILANRVRFPVFDLSDAQLGAFLSKFKKYKFKFMYGYTSSLVLFAKYIIDLGYTLKEVCPTLSACIVTSEVCTIQDKILLRSAFGVHIINEYGASELGLIAFSDPDDNWVLSNENLFIEVLDDNNQPVKNGIEGKIVITSLFNLAFPLIRYEIGDMGSIDEKNPSFLKNLTGRTNDIIILPSGKKSAGLTFYYISRSILESGEKLKEFIIRQTDLNTFIFDIVSDRELNRDLINKIKQSMDLYLEKGLNLEINYVSKIQRPNSGKIKHFYSQLNLNDNGKSNMSDTK